MKKKLVFSFLLLFLFRANADAQWYQVITVSPNHYPIQGGGIYFSPGGLWLSSASDNTPFIFYSSLDTGITWTSHTIVNGNPSICVNTIRFLDKLNGVLSILGSAGAKITSDGGQTWKDIIGGGVDLTLLGSVNRILQASSSSDLIIPFPFTSASSFPVPGSGSFSFAITPKGTVFTGHDPIQMSTDFGTTWQARTGRYDFDSWSMTIGKLCDDSTLYIANEWARKTPPFCEIYVSTDAGNSFTTKLPRSQYGYLKGSIDASKHAVFCATDQGVIRSTDKGQTWVGIGGPGSPFEDVRSLTVINDNTIFVLDSNGVLWRTDNSGGFPIIPPPPPMPLITASAATATSCDSGKLTASLMHTYCDALTITDAILEGTDAPYFTLQPPGLPVSLGNGAKVIFNLGFNPKKEARSFSAQIHVKGFYIFEYEDTIRIDTLIPVKGTATPVAPNLVAIPRSINFGKITTCDPPKDTIFTLINKGCDTLEIIDTGGLITGDFKLLTALHFPIILPPDSTLTIGIRFSVRPPGFIVSGNMSFKASQQSLTQELVIQLIGEGNVTHGLLVSSPQKLNFPSLTICKHDSASGYLTNIGCDSLSVDPIFILGSPDYSLSTIANGIEVKPGDTIRYKVYLNPSQKGIRQGMLILGADIGLGISQYDTIPFTVTVTDGTRILAASTNAVDFGTQSLCNPQKDTLVTIRNTGCDTLQVSGVNGLGSGFGTNTNFPITILPGDSAKIDIFTLLDTVGGKLSSSGTLTFASNSDNTLAPITLSNAFTASIRRDIGFFLDPTAKSAGDTSVVTFAIKEATPKSFGRAEDTTLHFDLNYNTDVLNFTSSKSSINLSSVNGKNFTITGSPITADANGILATIGFTAYLTKDSVTTIQLSPRTDTTILPCSMMTLSMGGSATFNYQFLCGERSLSNFLRDGSLINITSIHPNPAQDELEIDLQSGLKQDASIEIFNALGARVYFDSQNLTTGDNKIHLITKNLSSGVYLVKVGGVSQSLVISR